MKKIFISFLFIAAALTAHAGTFTKYVNPYIGTGGHGHVFLGANVPFGLVQVGPQENARGWDWCSGYHVTDSLLLGFSHLHLSGTGCADLGDILVRPAVGEDVKEIHFTHATENVRPGYYSLYLQKPQVYVELTATEHVAMHRYTFMGRPKDARLIFDLNFGNDNKMTSCDLQQKSAQTLEGFRKASGWSPKREIHFFVMFNQNVKLASTGNGSWTVTPEDASEPLLMYVALSPTSSEAANENLKSEVKNLWSFESIVKEADQKWNSWLSRVDAQTDDENVRTIFYTALYHAAVAPSIFSDVNGDYMGSDGKVHKNGGFTNYTTLSLWDTYRAFHPMMTLIAPEKQNDYAETFIHIFREQGKLPIWHLMGGETDCMVGSSAIPVLADLVLKGFVKDKQGAYEAMKKSALLDERSLGLLKQYGYIPYDKEPSNETVAKGLEYALDFSGIAKVAKMLGNADDYKYFYGRSMSYKKYFDQKTKFMRAVGSDGKFREPFNPIKVIHRADDYTEGNAWQYTWLVPHDIHGLVGLFGSEKAFTGKLDQLFTVHGDLGDQASPDISGLIGQYAHGNEPSHHILYIYNYVGQPWKSAKLLRQTMKEMYFNDYDGLSGNEDVGQMSAWYILSAMGIYQVEPSGGKFIIGSPLLNKAVINVGGGKTFTIATNNNSAENMYVQSAKLNGKALNRSYIMFNEITSGGTLELTMGPKPSKWGTAKSARP